VNDPVTGEPLILRARPALAGRLTRRQYANTVQDLFGVTLSPAALDASQGGLPADGGDGVFSHFASKQGLTEAHPLAYAKVAEEVAAGVDWGAWLDTARVSCREPTAVCGGEVVAAVGARVFRRELYASERERMSALFLAVAAEDVGFSAAAGAVLRAMLQSPQFLYRLEDEVSGTPGAERYVSGAELATRLAYFLWASAPDDALREAASVLTSSEGLEREVARMLASPRARRASETMLSELSRASRASFEGATDAQRRALEQSVVATGERHLWDLGGSVAGLFTLTEYVMAQPVAELLGVLGVGEALEPRGVSGLPERVGLLTHPAMIAGMGDLSMGSIVNRGTYLLERLLCRHPVEPPAAVMAAIDEFQMSTTDLNELEKSQLRQGRAECWGCHAQFEPLAYGFVRFDAAGRYVGELDPQGRPLALEGWVPISSSNSDPRYANVAEYMQVLSSAPEVQACFTRHFLTYAIGREGEASDSAHAQVVEEHYRSLGENLPSMLRAVAASELFRRIAVVSP
jgi:hypothetical protein